jgi:hypothetical protein
MDYQAPKSRCNLCEKEFSGKGMSRHIQSCIKKKLYNAHGINSLYIVVQSTFNHDYFFHLLLSPTATLQDIDKFLRSKWLECCGHMSAFSQKAWGEEIAMSARVNEFLAPGDTLCYQYDFGSTTELAIRCIGEVTVILQGKRKIQVLARNSALLIPCDECGKQPAVQICTACQWEDAGWLCRKCADKHDCGEDLYFLPVVNSPRAGVCNYTGE